LWGHYVVAGRWQWTGTAARPAPRTASQSAAVAYATVSPTGSYPAMGLVTDLLPHLVNGVSLGLLFALIALGFMLILGVMEVINLAHGSLFALGAYVALILLSDTQPRLLSWLAPLKQWPLGW